MLSCDRCKSTAKVVRGIFLTAVRLVPKRKVYGPDSSTDTTDLCEDCLKLLVSHTGELLDVFKTMELKPPTEQKPSQPKVDTSPSFHRLSAGSPAEPK